jgi:hypothetical protein
LASVVGDDGIEAEDAVFSGVSLVAVVDTAIASFAAVASVIADVDSVVVGPACALDLV